MHQRPVADMLRVVGPTGVEIVDYHFMAPDPIHPGETTDALGMSAAERTSRCREPRQPRSSTVGERSPGSAALGLGLGGPGTSSTIGARSRSGRSPGCRQFPEQRTRLRKTMPRRIEAPWTPRKCWCDSSTFVRDRSGERLRAEALFVLPRDAAPASGRGRIRGTIKEAKRRKATVQRELGWLARFSGGIETPPSKLARRR